MHYYESNPALISATSRDLDSWNCADIWKVKPVPIHLMSQADVRAGFMQ